MANYAVVDNEIVINVIVADSKEVAEEITGKTCIEYTDEAPLGLNWYWYDEADAYIPPANYPSWVYNLTTKSWEAPIPMPVEEGKGFDWNEETESWVAIDLVTE